MSLDTYPLLPAIKTVRKLPLSSEDGDLAAIKAVNNLIVTVEKTCQVGMKKETFLTQSGGKILETKREDIRRSLQSTLLLQAKKQLKAVEMELQGKRQEFIQRMAVCRERRQELEGKEKDVRDRMKKFERFIKENAIKQSRAAEKANAERKVRQEKDFEFVGIRKEMVTSNLKLASFKKQIKAHKGFESYLQSVLDVLPPNYLDVSEPQIADIISRYRTLKETHQDLVDEIHSNQEKVLESETQLQKLFKEKNDAVLINTSKLARQQKLLERKRAENQTLQEEIERQTNIGQERMRILSETKLAIDDMYERIKEQNKKRVLTMASAVDTNPDTKAESDLKIWIFKLHALQFRIKDLSEIAGK